MNCYISHHYRNLTSAGNKAKTDMEQIMDSMQFVNVGLDRTVGPSGLKAFLRNLAGVLRAVAIVGRGDVLVLQYPLKKYFTFVARAAHLRGARVVALVHDLGSCRRKAISESTEIARLGCADRVIATNAVMASHLGNLGLGCEIDALGVWDYLTDARPSVPGHDGVRVAYAGAINRRKNSFLYDWGKTIEGYKVDIYGDGLDMAQVSCGDAFTVHGYRPADELISTVDSDYGLVWDGDSLDTCSGSFGEYLALNTPHKVSLYIRCHLPLIVWSGSARAPFVLAEGIGFVVDSLRDIPAKLRAVPPHKYCDMKQRVAAISDRLARGHYFREALSRSI